MDELNKAGCSGDCGSCGEDCAPTGAGATVTLTLDDDSVIECAILTIFPVDDNQYIALLPLDENGESIANEVYLYRYLENDGNPTLENIMDDDEYEAAADAFDEWMDTLQFEEMDEE